MGQPERLSNYDALLLHMDNDTVAVQVAMATVYDVPIDFDEYLAWISEGVKQAPRLRQVLKHSFLNLRHPRWEEDHNFDIRNHVHRVVLDAPGDDDQLRRTMTEIYHRRMERDLPLWRMYMIEGMGSGGAVAMFCMHHCLADATGAMEIMKALVDPPEFGWPDMVYLARAQEAPEKLPPVAVRVWRTLRSPEGRVRVKMLWRNLRAPGPRFPFTRPVSGRMEFAWRQFSVPELKTIGHALGGTVTDVVLAILAGGLDRYAKKHGIAVDGQYLKVQLAANVRSRQKYGSLGNEVTIVPTLVPLGIADPAERVALIHAHTAEMKQLQMAEFTFGFLGGLMDFLTPAGVAMVCRLMASPPLLWLSSKLFRTPREHLLTTSVILPPLEFTAMGRRGTEMLGMVPCTLSMGMMCAAVAYMDRLSFNLTGDAASLPEIEEVMVYVEEALAELSALAHRDESTADEPSWHSEPEPVPAK